MTDDTLGGPDKPSLEALNERLEEIIDAADEPEDIDIEGIKNIINDVPPNEKRKEKAWLDLEGLVDRILASDGVPSEVDASEIYGFADKILGRS